MSNRAHIVQRTPVQIQKTAAGDVIQVDIRKLQRPPRTMACNSLDVYPNGNSSIDIVFAQRNPGTKALVAALVISTPRRAIPLLLNRGEPPTFREGIEAFLKKEAVSLSEMTLDPSQFPERIAFERASTMSMSYTDHEADIRFYRVLPTDFRRMQLDREITTDFLEPVVEIALSTELLASLVAKLDDLEPTKQQP